MSTRQRGVLEAAEVTSSARAIGDFIVSYDATSKRGRFLLV